MSSLLWILDFSVKCDFAPSLLFNISLASSSVKPNAFIRKSLASPLSPQEKQEYFPSLSDAINVLIMRLLQNGHVPMALLPNSLEFATDAWIISTTRSTIDKSLLDFAMIPPPSVFLWNRNRHDQGLPCDRPL